MARESSRTPSRSRRATADAKDRQPDGQSTVPPKLPIRPRRPNVPLLVVSSALFLIWLVVLVLLAIYA
jgi:hypothetical protein